MAISHGKSDIKKSMFMEESSSFSLNCLKTFYWEDFFLHSQYLIVSLLLCTYFSYQNYTIKENVIEFFHPVPYRCFLVTSSLPPMCCANLIVSSVGRGVKSLENLTVTLCAPHFSEMTRAPYILGERTRWVTTPSKNLSPISPPCFFSVRDTFFNENPRCLK